MCSQLIPILRSVVVLIVIDYYEYKIEFEVPTFCKIIERGETYA